MSTPFISVAYEPPLWAGVGDSGRINHLATYSQTIGADSGYDTASFNLAANYDMVYEWLNFGLGRHIEAFNEGNDKIWEGFANEIGINFDPLAVTIGPLIDIANRVTVKYSDFATGQPARTTAANDTTSQELYSIVHKVVSVGAVSSTIAEKIRDTYLAEHRFPETNQTLSGQASGSGITVNCLGYVKFLELYPYNEATNTTYTHREKALEVLGDSPNASYGIFSTNYNFIEANTLSVFRLDNDDRIAYSVLRDLVNMGGTADNNRRLLGVYDNRIVHIEQIPSTVEYTVKLSDPSRSIRTTSDDIVMPWSVRAGKWLDVVDFPKYSGQVLSLHQDPGKIFIESVTFNSPYGWQINGGKANTLPQQLAKLGLGGI